MGWEACKPQGGFFHIFKLCGLFLGAAEILLVHTDAVVLIPELLQQGRCRHGPGGIILKGLLIFKPLPRENVGDGMLGEGIRTHGVGIIGEIRQSFGIFRVVPVHELPECLGIYRVHQENHHIFVAGHLEFGVFRHRHQGLFLEAVVGEAHGHNRHHQNRREKQGNAGDDLPHLLSMQQPGQQKEHRHDHLRRRSAK